MNSGPIKFGGTELWSVSRSGEKRDSSICFSISCLRNSRFGYGGATRGILASERSLTQSIYPPIASRRRFSSCNICTLNLSCKNVCSIVD